MDAEYLARVRRDAERWRDSRADVTFGSPMVGVVFPATGETVIGLVDEIERLKAELASKAGRGVQEITNEFFGFYDPGVPEPPKLERCARCIEADNRLMRDFVQGVSDGRVYGYRDWKKFCGIGSTLLENYAKIARHVLSQLAEPAEPRPGEEKP